MNYKLKDFKIKSAIELDENFELFCNKEKKVKMSEVTKDEGFTEFVYLEEDGKDACIQKVSIGDFLVTFEVDGKDGHLVFPKRVFETLFEKGE